MDQNKKQKSLSQFIKSPFLKKAVTKLILSVSVFSLFFSHSTLLSFVHYFNFYFSTLPFKLFSHTLDKNCTFLLCNGLLVFLAKYSGLFSLSSSASSNKYNYNLNDHNESFKNYEDDSQPQMTIMETTHHHHHHHQVPLLEQEAELENTQTQQKQNAMQQENENKKSEEETHEEQEAENSAEETHEEQEEERAVLEEDKAEAEAGAEAEISFFIEEVDDEEEEEDGNGKLSNEELNKKFDDFIRKMKEELRIEARQQLIMV